MGQMSLHEEVVLSLVYGEMRNKITHCFKHHVSNKICLLKSALFCFVLVISSVGADCGTIGLNK